MAAHDVFQFLAHALLCSLSGAARSCTPRTPLLIRAVGAAVEYAARLDARADDTAAAVRTGRGKGVDGAFKAVEDMGLAAHAHLESLVVLVTTHFAGGSLLAAAKDTC